MKLVIWSFWTSDLKLDNEHIRENFLEQTKKIDENFDEYKNRISFDMLESFIKQNLPNEENIVIKWIFTDQNGFFQDTIYLKDIFYKYIKIKYNKNIKPAREHVILDEPRRIEKVKQTIDNELKKINQDMFEKIYIIPTWWTKWMTAWFTLSAISCLELDKIDILYGEEHDWKTIWIEQDDIIFSQYLYIIEKLEKHEDYKAILDFIDEYDLKEQLQDKYNIAKYFYTRLNADYETAEHIFIKNKLNSQLYISKDTKNILEESINGIIYTWRTWRYIEFLGRVYNFTDIATAYIIKNYYNLDDNLKYSKLKELSLEDEKLENFLNNYKVYIEDKVKNLQWDNEKQEYLNWYINTKIAIALIEYISQTKKEYKKYVDFFLKIEDLNQYRNHTIIGHWIKPVSKEIIEQKYNWNIQEDFKQFFDYIFENKKLWIDFYN